MIKKKKQKRSWPNNSVEEVMVCIPNNEKSPLRRPLSPIFVNIFPATLAMWPTKG